jgi:hypothetical protein
MKTLLSRHAPTVALIGLALLPSVAFASGGGTDAGGWELVELWKGWMTGWLGALIAIIGLFSGIVLWIWKRDPWMVLGAWIAAVLLVKGPDLLIAMFNAGLSG